jgi:hypothetical protein
MKKGETAKNKMNGTPSRYVGVTRTAVGYAAFAKGKFKRFTDEEAAAKHAAKMRGKRGVLLKKTKERRILPNAQNDRFQTWQLLYNKRLPGDAVATEEHAKTSWAMFKAEPALAVISILLKYGVVKNWLLEEFNNHNRDHPLARLGQLEGRAEWIRSILQKVALRLHNFDLDDWIEGCGRSVAKCQGPVPFLRTLHIIRKLSRESCKKGIKNICAYASKKKIQRKYVILVNKTNKDAYLVLTKPSDQAMAIDKIKKLLSVGSVVRGILAMPPKTLLEWKGMCAAAEEAIKRLGAPSLGATEWMYMIRWTLRGVLATALAHDGAELIIRHASIKDLLFCFPDASDWTLRLARKHNVTTVSNRRDLIRYKVIFMFCLRYKQK